MVEENGEPRTCLEYLCMLCDKPSSHMKPHYFFFFRTSSLPCLNFWSSSSQELVLNLCWIIHAFSYSTAFVLTGAPSEFFLKFCRES